MPGRMSAIVEVAPQLIASATLRVNTAGAGFTDITGNAVGFIAQISAGEGAPVSLSAPYLGFPRDLGECRSRCAIGSDCCT